MDEVVVDIDWLLVEFESLPLLLLGPCAPATNRLLVSMSFEL